MGAFTRARDMFGHVREATYAFPRRKAVCPGSMDWNGHGVAQQHSVRRLSFRLGHEPIDGVVVAQLRAFGIHQLGDPVDDLELDTRSSAPPGKR